LNVSGPSCIIDTACASALSALDAACKAMINGECDAAFVAGVNECVNSKMTSAIYEMQGFTIDDRCKTFDQSGIASIQFDRILANLFANIQHMVL
jgi:acyl transferase domain-containing protein